MLWERCFGSGFLYLYAVKGRERLGFVGFNPTKNRRRKQAAGTNHQSQICSSKLVSRRDVPLYPHCHWAVGNSSACSAAVPSAARANRIRHYKSRQQPTAAPLPPPPPPPPRSLQPISPKGPAAYSFTSEPTPPLILLPPDEPDSFEMKSKTVSTVPSTTTNQPTPAVASISRPLHVQR